MASIVCPANSIINNDSSWTNPTDIYTSNDVRASKAVAINTSVMLTIGFNTSSLPTNCTIDGFLLTAEGNYTGFTTNRLENTSRVYNSGNIGSGPSANSSNFPATNDGTVTLGGATDVWGTSGLTGSDVKGANFGIYLVVRNPSLSVSSNSNLDYVTLTVYYTPSAAVNNLFFGSNF